MRSDAGRASGATAFHAFEAPAPRSEALGYVEVDRQMARLVAIHLIEDLVADRVLDIRGEEAQQRAVERRA